MRRRILVLASTFAALGIGRWLCCMAREKTSNPRFDVATVMLLISGIVLFDIYRLHPSQSHKFKTLTWQYVSNKLIFFIGSIIHISFKRRCKTCGRHQEQLLKSILNQNRRTKCAHIFGADKIYSVRGFVTQVPLTSYSDYKDLVNEVESCGCENVFFPGKVDYLAVTSGTSCGKSKIFPKCLDIMRKRAGPLFLLQHKCMLQIPGNNYLRKWLAVKTYPKFFYSKSDIKSGPVSGIAAELSLNSYVTPNKGGKISNEADIIYINLVFGLLEEEIENLFFPTADLALAFCRTLEKKWKSVCDDIQNGTISNLMNIPYDLRNIFLEHLNGGNLRRAEALRVEFQKGFEAIVPRVWPGCPAVFCISSGTFRTQAKILKEKYLGHVPMFSPYHVATEAIYGLKFDFRSECLSYVATTTLNFFEFIPEEETEKAKPKAVLAHQVEIGRVYEIVVTTWEGLYRYRTEDLVEIVGFYGTVPEYQFVRRRGDILSASCEKVPESLLYSAICTAAKAWRDNFVVDYTTVESIHVENLTGVFSAKKFYYVFLEIEGEEKLTPQEKDMVDEELKKLHDIYGNCRRSGLLQPVKMVQVQTGTFEIVKNLILKSNPLSNSLQYKLPRIMRREDVLRYLLNVSVDDECLCSEQRR